MLTKNECNRLSKTTILRRYTKQDLIDFCNVEGMTGIQWMTKSQLHDKCCDVDLNAPGAGSTGIRPAGNTMMERNREALLERKEAFESDVATIQPSSLKNIVKKSDYANRQKKKREPIRVFKSIGEVISILAGDTPPDEKPRKMRCPKNVSDLVLFMNESMNDTVSTRSIDEKDAFDAMNGSYMSGVVVDRGYEFVLMEPSRERESFDSARENLSGGFNFKKCFEMVQSKSGNRYGVFLKR